MKQKKLRKKLSLNKTTIANLSLSADEMKNAVGGTLASIVTKIYSVYVSCESHCATACPIKCAPISA